MMTSVALSFAGMSTFLMKIGKGTLQLGRDPQLPLHRFWSRVSPVAHPYAEDAGAELVDEGRSNVEVEGRLQWQLGARKV